MSTPVITPIVTQLHPISVYLKAHEKLVLLVIAGLVLWFGIGKVDTLIQRHDSANLQQAKVTAVAQAEKTQAISAQVAQQAAQYQALADKVQTQNAALIQANTTLATTLAKQQRTDATLPPTELATRWNVLVPQSGVSTANGQVTLPISGAIATVQQLELVPAQQQTLANTQKELSNVQSLVTAEGQQVVTLNTEVGSLRLQITDNSAVCQAQIKVVKDAAAKSKRRWFYAGVVVGWVGRQLLKTETGF